MKKCFFLIKKRFLSLFPYQTGRFKISLIQADLLQFSCEIGPLVFHARKWHFNLRSPKTMHFLMLLNNFRIFVRYWQWHLKNTLQLKILRTPISICANSFLIKYLEMKIDEDAWKIISCTKILAAFSKNIAPRHFTTFCMLLFLSHKPSFYI